MPKIATIDELQATLSQRFQSEVVERLLDLARAANGPRVFIESKKHREETCRAEKLLEELIELIDWNQYRDSDGRLRHKGNLSLSCWTGYHGVKRDALKRFHQTVKSTCEKQPPPRRGKKRDEYRRELAKRVGRLLGESGIQLSIYDVWRKKKKKRKQSDFAFAASQIFNFIGENVADTKRYLTDAIASLYWDEEFMSQVPEVQRKKFKSIREYLPPREKGHSKFEAGLKPPGATRTTKPSRPRRQSRVSRSRSG